MASINGKRVRWYDPLTGKQRGKTCSSVKVARQYAERREEEARLYNDGFLDADQIQQSQVRVIPIVQVIEMFGADMDKRQVTAGHRRDVLYLLDRTVSGAGLQTVRDLTPQVIDRFLRRIVRDGKSAATHNHYRKALRDFCGWLVTFGYLRQNPVDAVKSMDESKDRRCVSRALTVQEADALVTAALSDRRKALYQFRLHTGLRSLEASRIVWSDIDLVHRTLHLRAQVTKNGKADVLPLTEAVCDRLVNLQREALRQGRTLPPSASVFGPPPDPRTWTRDVDRAGVERHTGDGTASRKALRRTFDVWLLKAGVDPIDVCLLMRHTPPGGMALTLGVYGDPDALLKRKRAALAMMARWIDAQRSDVEAATG